MQILFLDADSQPLVHPETLFDQSAYIEHGSFFWPDYTAAFEEAVSNLL